MQGTDRDGQSGPPRTDDADTERWVTVPEAAAMLGVSVKTIERRLKVEHPRPLTAELRKAQFGDKWAIKVDRHFAPAQTIHDVARIERPIDIEQLLVSALDRWAQGERAKVDAEVRDILSVSLGGELALLRGELAAQRGLLETALAPRPAGRLARFWSWIGRHVD